MGKKPKSPTEITPIRHTKETRGSRSRPRGCTTFRVTLSVTQRHRCQNSRQHLRHLPHQRGTLMATNSHIEWTEATWNPVTGCDKVSPGCAHCYAERMAKRLQGMGQSNYARGFEPTLQPHMLELPLRWKRSRRIFVNSMSDMFHANVPVDFIRKAFDVMRRADWHEYQILTKRSERLLELDSMLQWAPHIWMGVSVENARFVHRIDHLRSTHARTCEVPVARAAARATSAARFAQHRLGDRRRRIGTPDEADGAVLGVRSSGPMPGGRRRVLLQAVGRGVQEPKRARARRAHVGRDARESGGRGPEAVDHSTR